MSMVMNKLFCRLMLLAVFVALLSLVLQDTEDAFASFDNVTTASTADLPEVAYGTNTALASLLNSPDCAPYISLVWDAGWFAKGYYVNSCVVSILADSADNASYAAELITGLCHSIPDARAGNACELFGQLVSHIYLGGLSWSLTSANDKCGGRGAIVYAFYGETVIWGDPVC